METTSDLEILRTACSKCGQPVPINNDAFVLELIGMSVDSTNTSTLEEACLIMFGESRHLFPVYDAEGRQVCEGSPSRNQYLGMPPDTRPEYPLSDDIVTGVRIISAFNRMCESYGRPAEAPPEVVAETA